MKSHISQPIIYARLYLHCNYNYIAHGIYSYLNLLQFCTYASCANLFNFTATKCWKNQVYQECGTACPLKCGEEQPLHCTNQCVVGCACPSDLYMTKKGECVKKETCPKSNFLYII